jgi:iron complex transport system substrate-binding protein
MTLPEVTIAFAANCLIGVRGLFVMLFAVAAGAHAGAVTVTDDRGKAVTLPLPAQRIVTLAPSVTELVYAAGAGDRLVGVASYSDYPPAAGTLAQVGDASRIDFERVLSLNPDLVIGWKSGNHAADVERIEQLGFPVFMVEPETLGAISQSLRAVGALAGTAATAQRAAEEFEHGVAVLRKRYAARAKVRVFYEIWHAPLMTVNGRHMISDVIRLCGGANVFAGLAPLTPVVSLEGVIAAQPEVVLGGSSATTTEEFAAQWRRYEQFTELRNVRALYVDPDRIQRQTPRVLEGAETVCRHLDEVRSTRR